jgi:hypothetical protein
MAQRVALNKGTKHGVGVDPTHQSQNEEHLGKMLCIICDPLGTEKSERMDLKRLGLTKKFDE